MIKKLSVLFLSIFIISQAGIGFITLSATSLSVQDVTNVSDQELFEMYINEEITKEQYEKNVTPQKERFVCAGICTGIAIGVGIAAANQIMKTLGSMGFQRTCQKYEHKKGFDILCDTSEAFRDYGLNGSKY